MTKLEKLKKEWLKQPEFKAEYDELAKKFTAAEALARALDKTDISKK